jgi:hypothetical protein
MMVLLLVSTAVVFQDPITVQRRSRHLQRKGTVPLEYSDRSHSNDHINFDQASNDAQLEVQQRDTPTMSALVKTHVCTPVQGSSEDKERQATLEAYTTKNHFILWYVENVVMKLKVPNSHP